MWSSPRLPKSGIDLMKESGTQMKRASVYRRESSLNPQWGSSEARKPWLSQGRLREHALVISKSLNHFTCILGTPITAMFYCCPCFFPFSAGISASLLSTETLSGPWVFSWAVVSCINSHCCLFTSFTVALRDCRKWNWTASSPNTISKT